MKKYLALLVFCCLFLSVQAQITATGFYEFPWGSKIKKAFPTADCAKSQVNKKIQNCTFSWDSEFLDEFPVDASYARFYKKKLQELSFDLNRKYMPYIISRLSMSYGAPEIMEFEKEGSEKTSNRNYSITIYKWKVDNTYLDIIDKGQHLPLWVNVYYRSKLDADKTYIFNPKQ